MSKSRDRRAPAAAHRWVALFALLMPGCAASGSGTQQDPGRLQRASDQVTGPSGSRAAASPDPVRQDLNWDDDDEDGVGELLGEVLGPVLVIGLGWPFTVPHRLMEDEPGALRWASYLPCPYADAAGPDGGFLGSFEAGFGEHRQGMSLRTSFEYGSDFDDLERLAVAARLETATRLGLGAGWSHYRERLPMASTATLNLGDANLTYRFAQASYGELRAGIGANWFEDDGAREIGINATYGGDFYPAEPVVLSFELDGGTVGAATRLHARATVGAVWQHLELLLGFDYERLDSVSLPMWTAGLRVWF